jgi:hypothetical protein
VTTDPILITLCTERATLLRELAPVLSRVGHAHPRRSKVNAVRAVKRKALRRALRHNAELLASRCMILMEIL